MTGSADTRHTFFAPCPRGLEGVLVAELEELGARDVTTTCGGVGFAGPFSLGYRVNLESRIASRVLWRVFHGRYRTERDVYQAAYDLPWRDWFSARRTIKIKVSAQHCPLTSLDYATLKIKDAVCDKFRAATGARPSVDTRQPDIRIDAFLDDQHVTLYLDTSGEPLFKRGLRKASGGAPLRENLAAGILHLSRWTPEQALLDPMCGGGTILMEATSPRAWVAALHSRSSIPSIRRYGATCARPVGRRKPRRRRMPSLGATVTGARSRRRAPTSRPPGWAMPWS